MAKSEQFIFTISCPPPPPPTQKKIRAGPASEVNTISLVFLQRQTEIPSANLAECGVVLLVLVSAACPRSRVLPVQVKAVKVVLAQEPHHTQNEPVKTATGSVCNTGYKPIKNGSMNRNW